MNNDSVLYMAPRFKHVATFAALLTLAVALMGLAGVILHVLPLRTVFTGQVAIKVNTCIGFLLLAASLLLQIIPGEARVSRAAERVSRICAVAAGILGLASLAEIMFGWNLGIDQLLYAEPPEEAVGSMGLGLMSPITAISLVLLGIGLVALRAKSRRAAWVVQLSSLASLLVSTFAFLGLLFDFRGNQARIAVHTILALLVFSSALVGLRTDAGIGVLLASTTTAGIMLRKLLPAAFYIPVTMGLLHWFGARAGLYSQSADVSLMVIGTIILLLALATGTSALVMKTEQAREREAAERDKAQQSLQASEQRYRSLVVATAQIVWTSDPQGLVVTDIPSWRAFTGMTFEQIQGSGWLESLHPDDRERTAQLWSQSTETGTLYETEYRMRGHDGEYRHMAVRGAPVLGDDGRIREWLGTCTDITERKRAEEEIRKLNETLEQRVLQRTAELQSSNQELEAFTYSVSHDLRSPLRHLSGFSKLLLDEYEASPLNESARHYLAEIQDAARRMGQLVDDLLDLSRMSRKELRPQITGLQSLVEEAKRECASDMAGREVKWEIGDLPFAECDPFLMKQVFTNLLSNASKFTRPRKPAVIQVGQTVVDGQTAIFVRDNGVGFSMRYADKLFGIFQRLHRSEDFEGTGVGLALVQRIVHRHGGRVWAEAELDRGATFYFTLGSLGPQPSSNQVSHEIAVAG